MDVVFVGIRLLHSLHTLNVAVPLGTANAQFALLYRPFRTVMTTYWILNNSITVDVVADVLECSLRVRKKGIEGPVRLDSVRSTGGCLETVLAY